MRKLIFILAIMALCLLPCHARTTPAVNQVEGTVLHSIQSAWEIADETTSAGTEPSALAVTERTKLLVDAAITAAASGDDEISTYVLPSKWNAIRLRCIGITDAETATHEIYFGSLGTEDDCELTYAGSLAWTIGTQQSIYDQIAFTSGGTYQPVPGDTVTGNTSGETAVVVSTTLSSGAWADGDAAGTILYRSASGAFTNSETIKITNYLGVTQANVLTHAASDLVDFELADTLTATAKSWGSSWTSTSPADNTNAEAEIDTKGADYMVVVTSACTVDVKLLIKGF
ncbi:MAG: hypothetical protein ACYSX1_01945 [Planctomycetota bacterium]|jgi:hypothetical protein